MHVAVVADARRVQAVREIKEALERASTQVSEVFHLARDAKGAGFFNGRIEGRPDRTALVRSGIPVAARLAADTEPFHLAVPEATPQPEPQQWPGWRAPVSGAGRSEGSV